MTYETLIGNLEKKIYHPVYLLHGEEPYYIDEITDFISSNVLGQPEREFNQTVLYGRDVTARDIMEYAKRYPMMSDYQVVLVREAQEVKDLDDLQPYIEKPLSSTILVLAHKYKKVDRRRTLAKAVEKNGVLFESSRIYDNKVPEWITNRIRQSGYRITPRAAMILSENLGNNLVKIRNEMNKLFINIEKGAEINEDMIERNIGISKDYNIFELTSALGRGDIVRSNRITNYFADNFKLHPLTVTLTMIFNYFVKLMLYHQIKDRSRNNVASVLSINPFFVNEYSAAAKRYPPEKLKYIVGEIRNYDLRLKGINNNNTSEGELLRELIFKILH